MSSTPERYVFPKAAPFDAALRVKPDIEKIEAEEKALRTAMQQAYTEGFKQGRAAAELAAKTIFQDAQQQGFASGCNDGLVQVVEAATVLRQAFEQFREWRDELLNQAETFCVELVLAVVTRLLELNEASAEFVTRTVHAAIGALAPELPHAIVVNPANSTLVASAFPQLQVRADDSIPPGGVRVEAGRLLVEGNIQHAFEQIKSALLETRVRRTGPKGASEEGLASRSRLDQTPIAEGTESAL